MKKLITSALVCLLLIAAISGCAQTTASTTSSSAVTTSSINTTSTSSTKVDTTPTSYTSAKAITLNNETLKITSGGYYTLSGTIADGQILINTSDKVYIELAGVAVTNSKGPAIQVDSAKEVTITLKSGTENTLADGGASENNAAVFSNDTLIIDGEGKLKITGNNEHAFEGDDDIIINGGEITINAVNDGIHANTNVTINGGKITIEKAVEGIECKENDIVINGGEIMIYTSDDSINAAKVVTITGGKLYAESSNNDAIDSNGTISISGGLVVAAGAMGAECGIDSDGAGPVITGGTVLAVGGSTSSPDATASKQTTVQMGVTSNGGLMSLMADGKAVFTFKSSKSYSTVVYSSPNLRQGTTYSIYTGGSLSGGTGFAGYYEDGTYTVGTKVADFTASSVVTIQGGGSGPGGGKGGFGGGQGGRPNGGKMPPNGAPSQPNNIA